MTEEHARAVWDQKMIFCSLIWVGDVQGRSTSNVEDFPSLLLSRNARRCLVKFAQHLAEVVVA